MTGVLPDNVDISIRKVEGGFNFRYIEWSNSENGREIIENTYEFLKNSIADLGVQVDLVDGKIIVSGLMSREQIGSMITGEFLPWSHVSKITMGELFMEYAFARLALKGADTSVLSLATVSDPKLDTIGGEIK